jgi:hypothetical protein
LEAEARFTFRGSLSGTEAGLLQLGLGDLGPDTLPGHLLTFLEGSPLTQPASCVPLEPVLGSEEGL